jgi:HSP20 family protein
MAIVRWNPVREMLSVQDELNRVMGDVFGRRYGEEGTLPWAPPVDIEETTDHYLVRAELPGMKQDEIKITVEDNRLVIRGEKRRDEEETGKNYHRVERVFGQFERAFTLTHAVRQDRIEAIYKDGVLEVQLPKAEEAKAREIPVKFGK